MGAQLASAVAEYVGHRSTAGRKPATVKKDRECLAALLSHYGDVPLGTLAEVDSFFRMKVPLVGASNINSHVAVFRSFFEWCRHRDYTTLDPMYGREYLPVPPEEKRYIPQGDFSSVLNAARIPRDRMVIALGFYLFSRQGEIATLRVADVGRTHILVRLHKTNELDRMQINSELGAELRRWHEAYSSAVGILRPEFYLTPALERGSRKLRPTVEHSRCYRSIQRALTDLGWEDEEIDGEGGHLLRRSGARALYLHLREQTGAHHAMDVVQRRLHHANRAMTERYIGIKVTDQEMDDLLVGKPMFPERAESNITSLADYRRGKLGGA
jgi:integrase